MHRYIWQAPSWPHLSWDAEPLMATLGECRLMQGKLLSKIAVLGFHLEEQARAEILVEEIIKTSAIEGEQLDTRSVRSSVARRLGLPSAGLPVDRRIDDLTSLLLDATQNADLPLTPERLWGWQASLFPSGYSGMHKIRIGGWRDGLEPMRVVSGPLGRENIHFEAPPADRLDIEMQRFLAWWNEEQGAVESLLWAGVAHFRFVTIHPFDDGNGRIARALTDMALARDDGQKTRYYSLSAQIMSDRGEYYTILEKTQKGTGDITPWLLWFLKCFAGAVERSVQILAGVFQRAAFWRRHGEKPLSDRQRKVLNRVLDAGPGGFEGGLTTRKYAAIAGVSKVTASRELTELTGMGLLKRSGQGRSVAYEPAQE
jgi:Fic family protein